jgi:hypothetical protein
VEKIASLLGLHPPAPPSSVLRFAGPLPSFILRPEPSSTPGSLPYSPFGSAPVPPFASSSLAGASPPPLARSRLNDGTKRRLATGRGIYQTRLD